MLWFKCSRYTKKILGNYNINLNLKTIRNILNDILSVIYRYYYIEYQSTILGEKNVHANFSVEEV